MSFYNGSKKALSGFFRRLFGLTVSGDENIPECGAYIVVCNHLSIADVFILAVSCKRQIRFMAKKELFKIPLLSGMIRALGAFPVDRTGSAASALKTAIKCLKTGELVGLFPQGTRSPGKSVNDTPFKDGAAFCACRSGAGIIPAYIKTKNQKFAFFKKTELIFGKPIENSDFVLDDSSAEPYKSVTAQIKEAVAELEAAAYPGGFNG